LEFSGILKRCGPVQRLDQAGARFAGVRFAREARWKGDRWWLVAHGPGARLVRNALKERQDVEGIISTGFCGALDPALAVGAIVVSKTTFGEILARCSAPFVPGGIVSLDRVAVTVEEKRALRAATGCSAVDMEYAEVGKIAGEWGVPVAGSAWFPIRRPTLCRSISTGTGMPKGDFRAGGSRLPRWAGPSLPFRAYCG